MTIEIKIPRLGWSMDEGIFAGWLKHDGEPIRAGRPLVQPRGREGNPGRRSDRRRNAEYPPGALVAGEKVAVGTVVGYLLRAGNLSPARRARLRPSRSLARLGQAPRPPGIAKNHLAAKPASSPLARWVASRARHRLDPAPWQWHNGLDQESRRPRSRSSEAKSSAASLAALR